MWSKFGNATPHYRISPSDCFCTIAANISSCQKNLCFQNYLIFEVNWALYIVNRSYRFCQQRKKYQFGKCDSSLLNQLNKIAVLTAVRLPLTHRFVIHL